MPPVTGKLAVLLGGDGAGKSSVLRKLRELRPDWSYASIDPPELYPLPGLDYMNWALETPPRTYITTWGPLSRASFLAHALSLCYEERIAPALARGEIVLCDSYHYRVRAKERMLRSPGAYLVAALAGLMRVPDLVMWLDVDPQTAWLRNGGLCQDYETIKDHSFEGFREMQEGVKKLILDDLAGVPVRFINGTASVTDVATEVTSAVSALAGPGMATPAPAR
jgi:thymidylate kinase